MSGVQEITNFIKAKRIQTRDEKIGNYTPKSKNGIETIWNKTERTTKEPTNRWGNTNTEVNLQKRKDGKQS